MFIINDSLDTYTVHVSLYINKVCSCLSAQLAYFFRNFRREAARLLVFICIRYIIGDVPRLILGPLRVQGHLLSFSMFAGERHQMCVLVARTDLYSNGCFSSERLRPPIDCTVFKAPHLAWCENAVDA